MKVDTDQRKGGKIGRAEDGSGKERDKNWSEFRWYGEIRKAGKTHDWMVSE